MNFITDRQLDTLLAGLGLRQPRRSPNDYNTVGQNVSGPQMRVPADGELVHVLDIKHPICDETSGLSTIQLNVATLQPQPAIVGTPNGKLVAHVQWFAGKSGSVVNLDIDATGGFIITVAGTQAINIYCEQVSAFLDTPLVPGTDLTVATQVAWGGQAAPPRPAFMTGLIETVRDGVPGTIQPIPPHAQSVYVVTDNPVATTSIALINAGGTIVYRGAQRLNDPGAAAVAIVAGAVAYQITPGGNGAALAIFNLVP